MSTYEEIIAARRIDCPKNPVHKTFHTPEKAYERFCSECDAVWDIRSDKEIEYETFDNPWN